MRISPFCFYVPLSEVSLWVSACWRMTVLFLNVKFMSPCPKSLLDCSGLPDCVVRIWDFLCIPIYIAYLCVSLNNNGINSVFCSKS